MERSLAMLSKIRNNPPLECLSFLDNKADLYLTFSTYGTTVTMNHGINESRTIQM